jgi:DNA-binding NtrC family response regulator
MKQIVFISKSRLSQNLLGLLIPLIPTRTALKSYDSLAAAAAQNKAVNLLVIDANVLPVTTSPQTFDFLQKPVWKKTSPVLIHSRHQQVDQAALKAAGITHFYVKPFLSEELVTLIKDNLS